jgi:hypothetical protein
MDKKKDTHEKYLENFKKYMPRLDSLLREIFETLAIYKGETLRKDVMINLISAGACEVIENLTRDTQSRIKLLAEVGNLIASNLRTEKQMKITLTLDCNYIIEVPIQADSKCH